MADPGHQPEMNRARVVETVVIAIATSALSLAGSYVWTVPTLKTEIASLSRALDEIRHEVTALRNSAGADRADVIRVQERLISMQQDTQRRLLTLEQQIFKASHRGAGREP